MSRACCMRKPLRSPSHHLVELYQQETKSDSTATAYGDTSAREALNKVMPKAPLPDTNFTAFDVGQMVEIVVVKGSEAVHSISDAIGSLWDSDDDDEPLKPKRQMTITNP